MIANAIAAAIRNGEATAANGTPSVTSGMSGKEVLNITELLHSMLDHLI